MWFLDQVAEVRATTPRHRVPTVATAYLVSPPAAGRAVVRLWDGEEASVPAQPGVYSGISTVSVQVDQHGRPVLVLGPTTPAPVAVPEPAPEEKVEQAPLPDTPEEKARTVKATRSKTIYVQDSGTYTSKFGNWRSWGGSWQGHPYSAGQGSIFNSGPLIGAGFYGSSVKALGANKITKGRLRIVGAAQGYGWRPTVRLITNGSKPSGPPSQTGPTVTGPQLGWKDSGWVDLSAEQLELLRTGAARGVAFVGTSYGVSRGKGTSGLSLSLTYEVLL